MLAVERVGSEETGRWTAPVPHKHDAVPGQKDSESTLLLQEEAGSPGTASWTEYLHLRDGGSVESATRGKQGSEIRAIV